MNFGNDYHSPAHSALNCRRELRRASGDQRSDGSEMLHENSTEGSGDLESCIRAFRTAIVKFLFFTLCMDTPHEEIAACSTFTPALRKAGFITRRDYGACTSMPLRARLRCAERSIMAAVQMTTKSTTQRSLSTFMLTTQ